MGLLDSIPRVDLTGSHRLTAIPGQPPSLINLPPGCAFAPRCSFASKVADNKCRVTEPELIEKSAEHFARCHLSVEELLAISISRAGK